MNSFLDSHKALIITFLISAIVVLLAFSVHIKKRSELVAETFFVIEPELEEEIQMEDLEQIIQSLDQLRTNEAFNENQAQEDLEDEEFEKMLEEIRNRNEGREDPPKPDNPEEPEPEDNPAFDEINDIIKKRSEKNRESNKNSSISYSLVDRTHEYLPTPVYLCEYGGKIVVNITVDRNGIVTDAYVNTTSSSTNGCMIDHALEYARAAQFNSDASKSTQIGTITFLFRGKG